MRGKGSSRQAPWDSQGFTPAHAGKREIAEGRCYSVKVHPRTCGEKKEVFPCQLLTPGSPPHMRGKALFVPAYGLYEGFTPAHAGKSEKPPSLHVTDQVHPRTCGEKIWRAGSDNDRIGSPPHMRGKDRPSQYATGDLGFTPAHAGKSTVSVSGRMSCAGSPPHMRGKGPMLYVQPTDKGFTPAHAGKR